jgi:hypothetical protein
MSWERMVKILDETWNQEWLCWRGPAVIKPTNLRVDIWSNGSVRDSCQPVTAWAEEGLVVIRYQATACEDIEDLASIVVRSLVRELATAL